jgi:hypothetical protein
VGQVCQGGEILGQLDGQQQGTTGGEDEGGIQGFFVILGAEVFLWFHWNFVSFVVLLNFLGW